MLDGGKDPKNIHLVSSVLSGTILGVDALKVLTIEDGQSPEKVTATIDLAEVLGLKTPSEEVIRRAVVVVVGGNLLRIKVGEQARVESIEIESIHSVPAFLTDIARQAGIRSIFLTEHGIGYVADAELLDMATDVEHKR